MNWILLTVLAIIARSAYSIFAKILSKDVEVSPITQSLLLTTLAGMLSILLIPFFGNLSFSGLEKYWPQVLLLVFSQAFGNIFFYKGVKNLDAGVSQVAFSSILIWGALFSIVFLDSSFSLIQFIGIIIMFAIILMLQVKERKIKFNKSMGYVILSAFLFAIFQVASADIAKIISTSAYLLLAYFGTSIIILLAYFKTIKNDFGYLKKQVKKSFTKTIALSFSSVLYFVLSYLSFQQAPDKGVVVVLLSAQVVLSIIFGIIFLKEKDDMKKKLLAGVLALIAAFLIKG